MTLCLPQRPATWVVPEGLHVLGEFLGIVARLSQPRRPSRIGLAVALRSIDDPPVVENDHVGSDNPQVTGDDIDVRMSGGKVSAKDVQRSPIKLASPIRLPQLGPGVSQVVEGGG